MVVKLLGMFDLLSGIVLILLRFNLIKWVGLFFAAYLILKAILFIRDITSFIDIIAGIFIILAVLGIFNILSWIFVIWLLQKGIFSLMG
jgi:uncharacterized membrane protein HdeD (DUF308 family)